MIIGSTSLINIHGGELQSMERRNAKQRIENWEKYTWKRNTGKSRVEAAIPEGDLVERG